MAGILAGLLGRGTRPALATIWAVYMHGEAGRPLAKSNGTFGLLAREFWTDTAAVGDAVAVWQRTAGGKIRQQIRRQIERPARKRRPRR